MKKYTNEELDNILHLHQLWLVGHPQGVLADLSNTDLSNTNLSNAILRGVDLTNANLSNTDLSGANLISTILRGVDLTNAILTGADLWNTIGNNLQIKNIHSIERYNIAYVYIDGDIIVQIGCQQHSLSEWESFTDDEIRSMDYTKALDWWKSNKQYILDFIRKYPPIK